MQEDEAAVIKKAAEKAETEYFRRFKKPEGWVYRRMDNSVLGTGRGPFLLHPLPPFFSLVRHALIFGPLSARALGGTTAGVPRIRYDRDFVVRYAGWAA